MEKVNIKKPKKYNKLIPETNINENHVRIINIVWPKSGWETKNKMTGNIIKKLNKYLKYRRFWLFNVKIVDIIIIKKGFKISMGWNLGIKGKSIHLIEPFTSIPINGTSAKNMKKIINKYLEIWNNLPLSIAEKVIKINTPRIKKRRCLIKK